MNDKLHFLRGAFSGLLLASLAATPTFAQDSQIAAPETKIVGDWAVRCFAIQSTSPCEMLEIITQNKTREQVLAMSIAFAPQKGSYVLQLAVPLGVSLPRGAKIVAQNFDGSLMAFRRCDRGGCYVEGTIDPKIIDSLASAGNGAKVEIAAPDGRTISLPFSLRGFADARKVMVDLARQKASPAP